MLHMTEKAIGYVDSLFALRKYEYGGLMRRVAVGSTDTQLVID